MGRIEALTRALASLKKVGLVQSTDSEVHDEFLKRGTGQPDKSLIGYSKDAVFASLSGRDRPSEVWRQKAEHDGDYQTFLASQQQQQLQQQHEQLQPAMETTSTQDASNTRLRRNRRCSATSYTVDLYDKGALSALERSLTPSTELSSCNRTSSNQPLLAPTAAVTGTETGAIRSLGTSTIGTPYRLTQPSPLGDASRSRLFYEGGPVLASATAPSEMLVATLDGTDCTGFGGGAGASIRLTPASATYGGPAAPQSSSADSTPAPSCHDMDTGAPTSVRLPALWPTGPFPPPQPLSQLDNQHYPQQQQATGAAVAAVVSAPNSRRSSARTLALASGSVAGSVAAAGQAGVAEVSRAGSASGMAQCAPWSGHGLGHGPGSGRGSPVPSRNNSSLNGFTSRHSTASGSCVAAVAAVDSASGVAAQSLAAVACDLGGVLRQGQPQLQSTGATSAREHYGYGNNGTASPPRAVFRGRRTASVTGMYPQQQQPSSQQQQPSPPSLPLPLPPLPTAAWTGLTEAPGSAAAGGAARSCSARSLGNTVAAGAGTPASDKGSVSTAPSAAALAAASASVDSCCCGGGGYGRNGSVTATALMTASRSADCIAGGIRGGGSSSNSSRRWELSTACNVGMSSSSRRGSMVACVAPAGGTVGATSSRATAFASRIVRQCCTTVNDESGGVGVGAGAAVVLHAATADGDATSAAAAAAGEREEDRQDEDDDDSIAVDIMEDTGRWFDAGDSAYCDVDSPDELAHILDEFAHSTQRSGSPATSATGLSTSCGGGGAPTTRGSTGSHTASGGLGSAAALRRRSALTHTVSCGSLAPTPPPRSHLTPQPAPPPPGDRVGGGGPHAAPGPPARAATAAAVAGSSEVLLATPARCSSSRGEGAAAAAAATAAHLPTLPSGVRSRGGSGGGAGGGRGSDSLLPQLPGPVACTSSGSGGTGACGAAAASPTSCCSPTASWGSTSPASAGTASPSSPSPFSSATSPAASGGRAATRSGAGGSSSPSPSPHTSYKSLSCSLSFGQARACSETVTTPTLHSSPDAPFFDTASPEDAHGYPTYSCLANGSGGNAGGGVCQGGSGGTGAAVSSVSAQPGCCPSSASSSQQRRASQLLIQAAGRRASCGRPAALLVPPWAATSPPPAAGAGAAAAREGQ